MATGHYVQKISAPDGPRLHRAADTDRDQSYFLFATTKDQLAHLEFPLGTMAKGEVRALARELALPVADKPDSQDICFVPQGHYSSVIERLKPGALRPGNIVHADGRVMGRHDGIVNFTIGQRRGLAIPAPEPLYVLALDAEKNEVVVGPRDFLRTGTLMLRNVNWLGNDPLKAGQSLKVLARMRSSQRPQPATLQYAPDGRFTVLLHEGEFGVAPGQACVFYADDGPEARVLGGGWIQETAAGSAHRTLTAPAPGARGHRTEARIEGESPSESEIKSESARSGWLR
jgi:tRNA-specific 2-thiouridylase